MGLVGFCLSPMMGQVTVDYLSTPSFARRPALWLKLMSENRYTIAYSPSFGYDLAARRINGEAVTLDLSAGASPASAATWCAPIFSISLPRSCRSPGSTPKALSCRATAWPKSTLAITFADLDQAGADRYASIALHYKLSQRAVPASDELMRNPERVRSFVVCGKPIAGP